MDGIEILLVSILEWRHIMRFYGITVVSLVFAGKWIKFTYIYSIFVHVYKFIVIDRIFIKIQFLR